MNANYTVFRSMARRSSDLAGIVTTSITAAKCGMLVRSRSNDFLARLSVDSKRSDIIVGDDRVPRGKCIALRRMSRTVNRPSICAFSLRGSLLRSLILGIHGKVGDSGSYCGKARRVQSGVSFAGGTIRVDGTCSKICRRADCVSGTVTNRRDGTTTPIRTPLGNRRTILTAICDSCIGGGCRGLLNCSVVPTRGICSGAGSSTMVVAGLIGASNTVSTGVGGGKGRAVTLGSSVRIVVSGRVCR